MNRSDLPHVVKIGYAATAGLERHGATIWAATYDWQSPLRSGGAKGPKGDHGDPTGQRAIDPDPLATEHAELTADVTAFFRAAERLAARIERLKPVDPDSVERGRVNSVATCIVCLGPAPRCRRGLCEACYRAWVRADRPELHEFKTARLAALATPEREHVDPTQHRPHLGTPENAA